VKLFFVLFLDRNTRRRWTEKKCTIISKEYTSRFDLLWVTCVTHQKTQCQFYNLIMV